MWTHNGRIYRITPKVEFVDYFGTGQPHYERFNLLQVFNTGLLALLRLAPTWKTVKREYVPPFVQAQESAIGVTTWVSPLVEDCRQTLGLPA